MAAQQFNCIVKNAEFKSNHQKYFYMAPPRPNTAFKNLNCAMKYFSMKLGLPVPMKFHIRRL